MYIDYFLKFADKAEADGVLFEGDGVQHGWFLRANRYQGEASRRADNTGGARMRVRLGAPTGRDRSPSRLAPRTPPADSL